MAARFPLSTISNRHPLTCKVDVKTCIFMGDLARSCGSSSSAAKCVPLLQFSRLEKEVDAASAQCVRTT